MSKSTNQHYSPPLYFRNGHFQTIYPSLYRKIKHIQYVRERIGTPDNDFLDLDWSCVGSDSLVIVSHGLEGNSHRAYVKGVVKAFNDVQIDCLAWNYRSCSGETNKQLILYHNGATYDLDTVVKHAISTGRYQNVFLVGFSMGGNLSLLYAGEMSVDIHSLIKGVVTFSVPCDLTDSAEALAKWSSKIYMKHFLLMLHEKIKAKMVLFPDHINDDGYGKLKTFKDFDDAYTAPLHGFENAEDYWMKCSSRRVLSSIQIPSLIVNAADDPFLTGGCYLYKELHHNSLLTLEVPKYGGHVGFMQQGDLYWSEQRAVFFVRQLLN